MRKCYTNDKLELLMRRVASVLCGALRFYKTRMRDKKLYPNICVYGGFDDILENQWINRIVLHKNAIKIRPLSSYTNRLNKNTANKSVKNSENCWILFGCLAL